MAKKMIDASTNNSRTVAVLSHVGEDIKVSINPGDTWLCNYQGKLWPIVICNDTTPPEEFMKSRPSSNVLPVILLGKAIYIWTIARQLQKFDPLKSYIADCQFGASDQSLETDTPEQRLEKTRRNAFAYHAFPPRSPNFWKNYIEQRSEARRIERDIAGKRKRRRARSKSRLQKQPEGAVIYRSSKRRDSVISFADYEITTGNRGFHSPQSQRAKNLQATKDNPPADHLCTIFVGEALTPFVVPMKACEFLGDRIIFIEDLRNHIVLSKEFDTEAADFAAVAEYMHKKEFAPRLIDSEGGQLLQDIVTPEEKERAAIYIANIYKTAAKLRFGALQRSCVQKLKALQPLPPQSLLSVAKLVLRVNSVDAESQKEDWGWIGSLIMKQRSNVMQQRGH